MVRKMEVQNTSNAGPGWYWYSAINSSSRYKLINASGKRKIQSTIPTNESLNFYIVITVTFLQAMPL